MDEKAYLEKLDERLSSLKKLREDQMPYLGMLASLTNNISEHGAEFKYQIFFAIENKIESIDKEKWELEMRKIEFRLNRK